ATWPAGGATETARPGTHPPGPPRAGPGRPSGTAREVTAVDDASIGWVGLALSLILVGVAVGLSLWQGLRLEREMFWATGRALVQLLATGYVLVFVIDDDTPIAWARAWVVAMVSLAALPARTRAPGVPGSP